MKINFISNYINHHQIPFCDCLYRKLGEDFTFIQTEPMEEERVKMGWAVDARSIPYVHLLYEEPEVCRGLIEDCDLLLAGWMEQEELAAESRPYASANGVTGRGSGRRFLPGGWRTNTGSTSGTGISRSICFARAHMWLRIFH